MQGKQIEKYLLFYMFFRFVSILVSIDGKLKDKCFVV